MSGSSWYYPTLVKKLVEDIRWLVTRHPLRVVFAILVLILGIAIAVISGAIFTLHNPNVTDTFVVLATAEASILAIVFSVSIVVLEMLTQEYTERMTTELVHYPPFNLTYWLIISSIALNLWVIFNVSGSSQLSLVIIGLAVGVSFLVVLALLWVIIEGIRLSHPSRIVAVYLDLLRQGDTALQERQTPVHPLQPICDQIIRLNTKSNTDAEIVYRQLINFLPEMYVNSSGSTFDVEEWDVKAPLQTFFTDILPDLFVDVIDTQRGWSQDLLSYPVTLLNETSINKTSVLDDLLQCYCVAAQKDQIEETATRIKLLQPYLDLHTTSVQNGEIQNADRVFNDYIDIVNTLVTDDEQWTTLLIKSVDVRLRTISEHGCFDASIRNSVLEDVRSLSCLISETEPDPMTDRIHEPYLNTIVSVPDDVDGFRTELVAILLQLLALSTDTSVDDTAQTVGEDVYDLSAQSAEDIAILLFLFTDAEITYERNFKADQEEVHLGNDCDDMMIPPLQCFLESSSATKDRLSKLATALIKEIAREHVQLYNDPTKVDALLEELRKQPTILDNDINNIELKGPSKFDAMGEATTGEGFVVCVLVTPTQEELIELVDYWDKRTFGDRLYIISLGTKAEEINTEGVTIKPILGVDVFDLPDFPNDGPFSHFV